VAARRIAPESRSTALGRGTRLDERGGSTGIGLAIVQDVLDAYDWTLDLAASELGGSLISRNDQLMCRKPTLA
jgi:signal transduction histidine kinase